MQLMDWDGALGYKYVGLMPEAMSLAAGCGRGVAGGLPWLAFVAAEPMARLQESSGSAQAAPSKITALMPRADDYTPM